MWAVASNRDHWSEEEFFSTGSAEIDDTMAYLDRLGRELPRRLAMDFGCGVGRLTRALADHFEEAVGIDIAPSMVAAAKELNRDREGITFVVNEDVNLSSFDTGTFDLVYSNITLQHMKPELAAGYIESFLRVVSEKGLILFQLPSAPLPGATGVRGRLARARERGLRKSLRALTRRLSQPTMEMNCIPRGDVVALLERAGGEVLDVRPNSNAGPLYESYSYAAVRKNRLSS